MFLAIGCFNRDQDSEEILSVKDSTLASAKADIQTALEKKLYTNAVKTTSAMARLKGMTPAQTVLLKNAIQNVKVQLAEAAASGDTNAANAIQFFKSHSVVGR
jgi:hypothetical protein